MSDFEDRLAESRVYEEGMAETLRRKQWYVLPTYDYSGKGDSKAPKLLAPPGVRDLVLPDLLAWTGRMARWVEVKLKRRADLFRKTNTLVTGFSRRLWGHYQEVQLLTGVDVFVAFIHLDEGEVRGGTLHDLDLVVSHVDSTDRMCRGGMVFYRYNDVPRWCGLDQVKPR